jgi:hypothetical protein
MSSQHGLCEVVSRLVGLAKESEGEISSRGRLYDERGERDRMRVVVNRHIALLTL